MTYILGSRCHDGVVIITDTKFTTSNGPVSEQYDVDKITGEFPGFLTAFSGTRHKFERFRSEIREYRSIQPCQISTDRMLIAMSDIMERINPKLFEGFELLVGVLKHFYTHGGYVPVNTYKVIGSEPSGKFYLRYWHDGMSMKEVGELGYFIIKYIQNFGLDDAVGVAGHCGTAFHASCVHILSPSPKGAGSTGTNPSVCGGNAFAVDSRHGLVCAG